MRTVIGTAPAIFGPSALAAGDALCPGVSCACAGAHTAMTAAAAVSPVVRRNARRLGFEGLDGGSFRIEPPFGCINHFLLYSELVSVSHFVRNGVCPLPAKRGNWRRAKRTQEASFFSPRDPAPPANCNWRTVAHLSGNNNNFWNLQPIWRRGSEFFLRRIRF